MRALPLAALLALGPLLAAVPPAAAAWPGCEALGPAMPTGGTADVCLLHEGPFGDTGATVHRPAYAMLAQGVAAGPARVALTFEGGVTQFRWGEPAPARFDWVGFYQTGVVRVASTGLGFAGGVGGGQDGIAEHQGAPYEGTWLMAGGHVDLPRLGFQAARLVVEQWSHGGACRERVVLHTYIGPEPRTEDVVSEHDCVFLLPALPAVPGA